MTSDWQWNTAYNADLSNFDVYHIGISSHTAANSLCHSGLDFFLMYLEVASYSFYMGVEFLEGQLSPHGGFMSAYRGTFVFPVVFYQSSL
jgi:hypothetical protein